MMKKTTPHKQRKTLITWLRQAFLAGILVTTPFIATVSIAVWLIDTIDNKIVPLLPKSWKIADIISAIPGGGVIVLIVGLTLIGGLAGGLIGRGIVNFFEKILDRTPLRVFYNTVKQIMQTMFQGQNNAFKKPVMIEYPRKNVWAVGFITNEEFDSKLAKSTGNKNMISIFLPTTPNPTSGFLLFVPKEDLYPLDMSVEEAIKLVISAGIVTEIAKEKNNHNQKERLSSQIKTIIDQC